MYRFDGRWFECVTRRVETGRRHVVELVGLKPASAKKLEELRTGRLSQLIDRHPGDADLDGTDLLCRFDPATWDPTCAIEAHVRRNDLRRMAGVPQAALPAELLAAVPGIRLTGNGPQAWRIFAALVAAGVPVAEAKARILADIDRMGWAHLGPHLRQVIEEMAA